MTRVSAVVPVLDGARHLDELLAALRREGVDEILVIDSGSSDGSPAIARAAGAEVIEIPPAEFGHGRTRNLGVRRTGGELVAFLTQDAAPVEGWLDAYREAMADERVAAAYGPHLPRADTSPMIARELEEFFAGMVPAGVADGAPVLQGPDDAVFLSNVNACYRRDALEAIGFRDLPYAEDQAFARDLLASGRQKAYVPRAGVLHAHDYPWSGFMRRYFDEYRGLRQTLGHVEEIGVRSAARHVRAEVAADRRWMVARGVPAADRRRLTARSAAHHAGRRVFSALGSRAERVPAPARRRLSLEGRADGAAPGPGPIDTAASLADAGPPPRKRIAGTSRARTYRPLTDRLRAGPVPLLDPVPGMAAATPLHVAVVVPPFGRGSGGHASIFQIVVELERMGHTCSIWLDDPLDTQYEKAGHLRGAIREWFAPVQGPAFKGFEAWFGADVAVATGWQTVYPVLGLDQTRARAYLVHDHENEFYATSVERTLASRTYDEDLFCICSSPWLLELMEGYGRRGSTFRFGVDHDIYHPRPVERSDDLVVFYGRGTTPRRAVPVGMVALEELARRRPRTQIAIFGSDDEQWTAFDHDHVGVVTPAQLAWLYSQARVGLCLSMTNHSLIPQEMLACGLPCVDLAGYSSESVYGPDGALELAELDPVALAEAMARLLDDRARWERRSQTGLEFVAGHTWAVAASDVEAGLRAALRDREAAWGGGLSVEARDDQQLAEEAVRQREGHENGAGDGAPPASGAARREGDGGGVER